MERECVVDGNGTRHRVQLSDSPLARQDELVHTLATQMQEYLYFPNPDPLYVVLGTIAGNILSGRPLWMMLVGAPSSGRTAMLETLQEIPRVFTVGALKGTQTLLSGTPKKDWAKDAKGGLLNEIGTEGGLLCMTDFTRMLSMERAQQGEIMSALRDVYDGKYERPIGGEGGKKLYWYGKVGFLGACTNAIDQHSHLIRELGERWVYYRYPDSDGYGEVMTSLGVTNPKMMMSELRGFVRNFVDALGLDWRKEEQRRAFTKREMNRIFEVAAFGACLRTGVPRDWRTKEIIDKSQKELPTRLANGLGQLYLGLERIGISEDERWRLLSKVAFDSAPQIRIAIVNRLLNEQRTYFGVVGATPKELQDVIQCSTRTTEDVIDDLIIGGVCEWWQKPQTVTNKFENGKKWVVRLSKKAKEMLEIGWKGREAEENRYEDGDECVGVKVNSGVNGEAEDHEFDGNDEGLNP